MSRVDELDNKLHTQRAYLQTCETKLQRAEHKAETLRTKLMTEQSELGRLRQKHERAVQDAYLLKIASTWDNKFEETQSKEQSVVGTEFDTITLQYQKAIAAKTEELKRKKR